VGYNALGRHVLLISPIMVNLKKLEEPWGQLTLKYHDLCHFL
jgi:hypothetical protein